MSYNSRFQFSRRQFLQGLAAMPLLAKAAEDDDDFTLDPEIQGRRRIPTLQTWADHTSALVVVLGKDGWTFNSENAELKVLKTQKFNGTEHVLYKLQLLRLSITEYSSFTILNEFGRVLDQRRVKGLDLDLALPKIIVASCSNFRKRSHQEPIYGHLRSEKPDLIFFTGDVVYANSKVSSIFKFPENPESALKRYIFTWQTVDLYQLDPLVPTMAVWDDHDYGANDGDYRHPYKRRMKNLFRSFFAMPESHERLSFGPGVSFKLDAFGMDLFMLDGRTHRKKHVTQWGKGQEVWLAKEYTSNLRPTWILNGVQFFKYFIIIESVEKSAKPSLQRLIHLLREHRKPTVLFSGDVHGSQVQEIPERVFGYKTYEITSSGIHCNAAGLLLRRKRDEGQIYYCGHDNFLIVKPKQELRQMELSIYCVSNARIEKTTSLPIKIQT